MQSTSKQKEIIGNKNMGGFTMKKFFKELLNKRLNNEKGLTLIELLAVIVILAIISAIAIPAIGGIIDNSKDKAEFANAMTILNAAKLADSVGDCDITAASAEDDTKTVCNKTSIGDYVEGIDGSATYSVYTNTSTNDIIIEYSKLESLKGSYGDINKTDGTVSEENLRTLMGGN